MSQKGISDDVRDDVMGASEGWVMLRKMLMLDS